MIRSTVIIVGEGEAIGEDMINPIDILLIEDNPANVRLTREALKEEKLYNNLSVVSDGVEAMNYLYRKEPYSQAPSPDLVLLDLNLPRKDGREVLAEMKNDTDLRSIPVVVLTVSSAEKDIIESYDLHANCYITKPLDLNQFSKVFKSIQDFWLTIVKLPAKME